MVEIRPLATRPLMHLGQQGDCLAASIAALLAPTHPSLGGFQRVFGRAVPARVKDACPNRQSGKCFYAKINPRLLTRGRQGLYWHIGAGEADIPAIGFSRYGDGLGRALQGATPAHSDPANLG